MIPLKLTLVSVILFIALKAQAFEVYFGTSGGKGSGIYYSQLDPLSGELSEAELVADVPAPGFLVNHPTLPIVYAASGGNKTGYVRAFDASESGKLKLLNQAVDANRTAAHIAVHPSGKCLVTVQYGGASAAVFPLNSDGRVGEMAQRIQHEGPASGVIPWRQKQPHPHWVGFSPDGRFAYVPDLGKDTIEIYAVDVESPAIEKVGSAKTIPGGGPRHMRFSRDGKFVYLLNELTVSISVFAQDQQTGLLEFLHEVPSLTEQEKALSERNTGSEILVSSDGKFVYTGNRGHNSVSTFRVGSDSSKLERIDIDLINGDWPRNINLSPDGKWVLAGGQRSGTVSVLKVDPETGMLDYVSQIEGVPNVSCILFR